MGQYDSIGWRPTQESSNKFLRIPRKRRGHSRRLPSSSRWLPGRSPETTNKGPRAPGTGSRWQCREIMVWWNEKNKFFTAKIWLRERHQIINFWIAILAIWAKKNLLHENVISEQKITFNQVKLEQSSFQLDCLSLSFRIYLFYLLQCNFVRVW